MMRTTWHALIILLVLSGCTSSKGLDRAALRETLRQDAFHQIDTPNQTDRPPALRLTLPAKFALYLTPTGFLNRHFDWTGADKDVFRLWAQDMKSRGVLSDLYVVAESSATGKSLQHLRDVAARYGADVLLIVDGADDIDRYNNYKGPLFYWTILGAYLAAGTHSDALCLVMATLWDVRTGVRYFTEEAEGLAKTIGPVAFLDDKDPIAQAKTAALRQITDRLKDRLLNLTRNR